MVYTLSYQMYKYEHGLSAAEQQAEDVRAGQGAAALRDLEFCLRRAFRLSRRADAGLVECPVRERRCSTC
jgi:hypothetical protein